MLLAKLVDATNIGYIFQKAHNLKGAIKKQRKKNTGLRSSAQRPKDAAGIVLWPNGETTDM